MSNLCIQESLTNESEGYRIYDGDVEETYCETIGELYRMLVGEYGRCVGKMFRDLKAGGAAQVGWVFEKRVRYDDSKETYLQHAWISVHDAPPTRTVEYHTHDFGRTA